MLLLYFIISSPKRHSEKGIQVGLSHLNEYSSNTIFQIVLITYVPIVWTFNQLLAFFSTAFVFQVFVKPSLILFYWSPDSSKVELVLYGSPDLRFTQNSSIICSSIIYIIKSERFKGNLFWTYFNPKLHLSYPEIAPLSYTVFII